MTPEIVDLELELLLQGLCAKYGYDFRDYDRASMKRRIEQSLPSFGCATISHLQSKALREEAVFIRLLSSLAVTVTELFRDPEFFASLRTDVLPYLRTYPSLKLWVAGCSSGEEVLSFCIMLREEGLLDKTLIYATDINPASLERARRGLVRQDDVALGTRRYQEAGGLGSLSDYYAADYGSVLFDPGLLANVVFAEHSLATDAVFSEVHLVSCRNVLIYFDRHLQNRALGLFDEALRRRGFLCLGSSETLRLSTVAPSFETVALEQRIFQKR